MGLTNMRPAPLDLLYRIANYITEKILENDSFNIFELKELLEEMNGEAIENKEHFDEAFFETCVAKRVVLEDEEDGNIYIAGQIAQKMSHINSSLGYSIDNVPSGVKIATSDILGELHPGFTYPTQEFLAEVTQMSVLFENYHPPGDLKSGIPELKEGVANLQQNFAIFLQDIFPHREFDILSLFSNMRTRIRGQ